VRITPILILAGQDVSRYFISCHMEQTANSTKDPGKYDLVIANPGGKFTGAFAPKSVEEVTEEELGNFVTAPKKRVSLQVITSKSGCEGDSSKTITIFSGEIQKAEADELYLKIEGSCSEGGMTARINPRIWPTGTPITTIVNDLLDDFGYTRTRHIMPAKNTTDDVNPTLDKGIDFDTALYTVSCWAESIYFFDENDDFWFVPATNLRGFSNLTGNILRGSNATNMVGYCNHVDVYGGSPEDLWEGKTHNLIHAWAEPDNDWEIQSYGLLKAPPVVLPNADLAKCQEVADKLLEWYRQYKDVPTVKVVGKAPGLLSKVAYRPWNGDMPPVKCEGPEEAEMGAVMGLVTRRVVDISSESGFVSSLDVTTNFLGVNKPTGDDEVRNFYNLNRAAIDADDGVVEKYPGVFFV
jgi:hypothetical protein